MALQQVLWRVRGKKLQVDPHSVECWKGLRCQTCNWIWSQGKALNLHRWRCVFFVPKREHTRNQELQFQLSGPQVQVKRNTHKHMTILPSCLTIRTCQKVKFPKYLYHMHIIPQQHLQSMFWLLFGSGYSNMHHRWEGGGGWTPMVYSPFSPPQTQKREAEGSRRGCRVGG